jgi:hypothetical protein
VNAEYLLDSIWGRSHALSAHMADHQSARGNADLTAPPAVGGRPAPTLADPSFVETLWLVPKSDRRHIGERRSTFPGGRRNTDRIAGAPACHPTAIAPPINRT